MHGCPACVRGFAPSVAEDASQVRRDMCADRHCPLVSAGACVRTPVPEHTTRKKKVEVTHPARRARPTPRGLLFLPPLAASQQN